MFQMFNLYTFSWMLILSICSYLVFTSFFYGTGDWTQGCSTSALHPRPYFLYFILKPGLTKLWRAPLSREREKERERERERDREREREKERELRLAANPDPPVSASQVLELQVCATTPGYYATFDNKVSPEILKSAYLSMKVQHSNGHELKNDL